MSKPKKHSPPISQLSKQEKNRKEQEQQQQKTRILIVSAVALVVIIFVVLFMIASNDTSSKATTAEPVNFNYSDLPRLGEEDAPVKIVEFGDFKCPACAQFSGVIKPQIVQEYVETGKAALYFVNMAFIGPDSETASLAALSVYHQSNDEFWKYYDAIYANQGKEDIEWATADFLVSLAEKEKLAIDYDLLRKDIEDRTYADELTRDIKVASDSSVTNTPTLFINGVVSEEPFNIEAISADIDAATKVVEAK
ncbi:DsbA family protein [Paenibacillus monticola]|uniref:Thioredoxin domain-containing protein n=1 Tax=Paenibacillus monticola TaxID=2666075 RepID=A0A7X2H6K4_9BACL|nr:thioredoxin domain-containing protein [Paenibacillus monticola]MRN54467.1 thioredoxin domain-containing protein [Paenibacillus monticola]